MDKHKPSKQDVEAEQEAPRALEPEELEAIAAGKRSTVKDSHDRYANIEVSY